ncbi:hypothetical protein NP493_56g06011 [Ridgeia piscesae]|uniref:Uncharacterized protein n=1 Tax=Ridgeia piscesae TaxID=27915 RepID=A0AAD9PAS8_RIDPI|nr:hypothetical protein NP493_56g06011 [Ridgeia piscesae]
MRIMNCTAICQVAGFSARFQNPEGIAAVCSIRVPRKSLTGVFLGDSGYIFSQRSSTRGINRNGHTQMPTVST